MRILIISDTHGKEDNLKRLLKKEKKPDRILHLGDLEAGEEELEALAGCPLDAVCGNCDYFSNLPDIRLLEIGSQRIMMTHGHRHFVSAGLDELIAQARANNCNVVMFGHTHRPLIDDSDPEITVINPGSLSLPRQENRKPSYIWMEIKPSGTVKYTLHYL